MLLTNFLEKRKSVRNFTDESADSATLDKVKSIIKNSEEENYILFENGKIIAKGLEGKAGYNNTMIVAPHYIGLPVKGSTDEDRLKTGYYLEKINTELIRLGLSTCWITVDNVDDATSKSVFGEEGANISYLIAFGYPKARKLFDPKTQSERKPVSEIVFVEDFNHPATAEDLEVSSLIFAFVSDTEDGAKKLFVNNVLPSASFTCCITKVWSSNDTKLDSMVPHFLIVAPLQGLFALVEAFEP